MTDDLSQLVHLLRTCVQDLEVNGRRYLYIPADIEVHTNMFLKTFLEAGVPLSEEVQVKDMRFHVQELCVGAQQHSFWQLDRGN